MLISSTIAYLQATYFQLTSSVGVPILLDIFPVMPDECFQITQRHKITKTNLDEIPIKVFQLIYSNIIHPLIQLLNISFRTGICPDILKQHGSLRFLNQATKKILLTIDQLRAYRF